MAKFDGISGTSAGAMNAVVMADGLAEGGAEGARGAGTILEEGLGRGTLQSVAPRPARRDDGTWTLDTLADVRTMDMAGANALALRS